MSVRSAVLAIAVACAFTMRLPAVQPTTRMVKIDAGPVNGVEGAGSVAAFLGIPYAVPPVGDLRWRPPQPAPHWQGVRQADRFGTSCMQNQVGSRLPWTEEFMTQGPIGEDCLFLNVWTGAKSANAKLPVMFWIYGGGFNEGSSSVAVYDGAELAKQGVIVVSVNYRVGPLGFLAHPELTQESEHHVSGNYGLLDQIAALQWVHANIGAFGGDPDKVTIFGQSAGAISVLHLMHSPLAKGLFARAIAQSGPGLLRGAPGPTPTLGDREAIGVKYAESKGAHSLAELRALPAAAFFTPAAGGRGTGVAPANSPFKDGWVIPLTDPAEQVPLMVGFVADDIGAGSGDADQKKAAREKLRIGMDAWATEQAKASKRVYTYYFDRVTPWPAHPEFGAHHTSEVPYIFRTIHRVDRPWEAIDDKVSETVSAYWVNFAKKGDPNRSGLPAWPLHDDTSHVTMELGVRMGPMNVSETTKPH